MNKPPLFKAVLATALLSTTLVTSLIPVYAQKVTLPPVSPASVTGNIVIAGSSTVYPLTQKIAEQFRADGYAGNLTVDSIGSGAGIARFCRGEIDIANASRAMNATEIAQCKAIGREPIQFRVGTDALSIVMDNGNSFVKGLNRKQIALIFSGKAKIWKDVNNTWPAETIKLFSPGTDSGTYDYFTEEIFKEETVAARRRAIVAGVLGIQLSEDDNVLVQGVESSPYAIGYFGYAYYLENKAKLKILAYEGVTPSDATVAANRYKFSRPLFIITTAKIMTTKPQVASFVNYYLTNVNKVIKRVGYFPEPNAALDSARTAWISATQ